MSRAEVGIVRWCQFVVVVVVDDLPPQLRCCNTPDLTPQLQPHTCTTSWQKFVQPDYGTVDVSGT